VTATERVKEAPARPNGVARRFAGNLTDWLALLVRPTRGPRPAWPQALSLAAGGLFVVITLAAVMLFLDARTIDQVRYLPLWLVDLFNEITDYGKSGWPLWPCIILVVALVLVAALTPSRFANLVIVSLVVRLEFVIVAVAAPSLIVTIGKRLIGRVRPSALGPFAYVPFSWRPDYAGMPSGHSTSAFAAAVAIGMVWPRARPLLWIYAIVIAASRVIISAHYPSDVIAGAVVGALGAVLVRRYFAARRLAFAPAPDGRVRRLPGPSWRRIKTIAAKSVNY